jgi:hypothetical protein
MKNIHILPTSQPSNLLVRNDKPFVLMLKEHSPFATNDTHQNQNIYITSDEEIKDGEYGLSRLGEIIKFHSGYDYRYYAKIILTTDQDLIKDGVQAIPDDFLEWFVKNPSCEYVEVKKFFGFAEDYLIIIPKEEPKEFDIRELNRLDDIEIEEMSNDWATMSQQIKPKQETLEEVAERFYGEEEIVNDYDISGYLQSAFLTGAKWQQEQDKKMYSELSLFLEKEADKDRLKSLTSNQIRTLIEQFKKK